MVCSCSGSGVLHADVPFPMIHDMILDFDQIASYHDDIVEFQLIGTAAHASANDGKNKKGREQNRVSPGCSFKTVRRCNGTTFEFRGSITNVESKPNKKVSLSASYDCGKMSLIGGGGYVETFTFSAYPKTKTSCDVVYSFAFIPVSWLGRLLVGVFRQIMVRAAHKVLSRDMQCVIMEAKRRTMLEG